MASRHSRRKFLKNTAVVAGAVAGTRLYTPAILHAENKGEKIRVAMIGCGGQGSGTHATNCVNEKLVAMVDPDPSKFANAIKNARKIDSSFDGEKVEKFDDYRKLFDKMAKELDAVSVATPNHHHAPAAMMAMSHGLAAYVEKPLTFSIWEGRELVRLAKEKKVATQMGNQGHSREGYRRLCEFIWAGAIGKVTEVYCWTDRANGGIGPRSEKADVPAGMNWDAWIGPAAYRDYHKGLHPHEWHGWHDFGNGSLGNMGCHVMDGAHWALKLGHPDSVEVEDMLGGSDERYPVGTRIRWDFPARQDMPPVKLWWFDGRHNIPNFKENGAPEEDAVSKKDQNFPPLMVELFTKNKWKLDANGSIYVGEKGVLFSGTYGEGVSFVPANKDFVIPEKTIPRVTDASHHANFFNAIRNNTEAVSNFGVGSKLSEIVILGSLAMQAGQGKKLEWDGDAMKVKNMPELSKLIKREYRQGWA